MNYKKTQPEISYPDFLNLTRSLKTFKSLRAKQYDIVAIEGSQISFIRKSSCEKWKMDLKGVHQAYIELMDFKTNNFKTYVNRTHSPALGLLLELGLLR
ncbi:MAG: hypothetical protein ACOH2A_15260 [Sphingobacteriaceae bacterium]